MRTKPIAGSGEGSPEMFYWGQKPTNFIDHISGSKALYLTFDDGPDSEFTPKVLDLLASNQVTASFFVIGQKARQNPTLIRRMLREGHGVFSHSNDHDYRHYFKSAKSLKLWLRNSIDELEQLTGNKTVSFRPPAGVLTPPLVEAAKELGVYLVLWSHRFYDTVWPLYRWHCQWKMDQMQPGDIVLLHDTQQPANRPLFFDNLEFLIESIKHKQFAMMSLSEEEFPVDEFNRSSPICRTRDHKSR